VNAAAANDLAAREHWNRLHSQRRFRPEYPNENVVRFLMNQCAFDARQRPRALDIGVGGGRHTKLLCEIGFETYGVDVSDEGLRHCRARLHSLDLRAELQSASMSSLPFADGSFAVALAIGVYCYADSAVMAGAVAELHRVLRQEGAAMILVRSVNDYRFGKGDVLGRNTFRLTIEDTNELGTVQRFLDAAEIPEIFSAFAEVHFESTETTSHDRQRVHADWLITVRK